MDCTKGVCIMQNDTLSDTFKPFLLPTEPTDFGVSGSSTQQIVLVLRKLLGAKYDVFYRHTPAVDGSGVQETILYTYSRGHLREVGRIAEDTNLSLALQKRSSSVIVDFTSDMATNKVNPWESLAQTLRICTMTADAFQRVDFVKTGPDTYIVQLWNSKGGRENLAKMVTGYRCIYFAIELL